jgi:endogenous inhibitor of DNA gyrase (YacG/DUF329 family)
MPKVKTICQNCGKVVEDFKIQHRKYCSLTCHLKVLNSKTPWNKGLKGYNKDYPRSKEWCENISRGKMKENVGYRALHEWVEKRLGKPMCCDHCGITTLGRYHWANRSGLYMREITDWIRLCPKCHIKYDKERGGDKYVS